LIPSALESFEQFGDVLGIVAPVGVERDENLVVVVNGEFQNRHGRRAESELRRPVQAAQSFVAFRSVGRPSAGVVGRVIVDDQ